MDDPQHKKNEAELTSVWIDDQQYNEKQTDDVVYGKILEDDRHSELSTGATEEKRPLISPWASYSRTWNKIFLASCVVGVSIDPLFLYIPVVNEAKKCLAVDENMKIIAVVLRTFTDFFYVLHIAVRIYYAFSTAKELNLSIHKGIPWSYLLVDILAILPLPQVIILKFFAKIAGSRSLATRKVLNFLLLLQYVPRIIRVYLCGRDLQRTFDSLAHRVWVRGAFYFFLYIIFGHVLGAFWYFYSIYRETACWHHACTKHNKCVPSLFECGDKIPINNLTFIAESCPVDPPKEDVFNFGIYGEAIKCRTTQSTKFFNKFTHSFWWGLRNLSSFGQNLETSSNEEENLFAILISICGLLVFLYLIGNVQTYMQLAATKSQEKMRKMRTKQQHIEAYLSCHKIPEPQKKHIIRYLGRSMTKGKEVDHLKHVMPMFEKHVNEGFVEWISKIVNEENDEEKAKKVKEAESWIDNRNFPTKTKNSFVECARLWRFRDSEDVDVTTLLPILPLHLRKDVKKHLCLPILDKVPKLVGVHERVYNTMHNYLKPVVYQEKSYIIREGEPLDMMLLIINGVVWSFAGNPNTGHRPTLERLQGGDYYGNELLEWQLRSTTYSDFPIAASNVKAHTKVEAFVLLAVDLKHILDKCWSKFPAETEDEMKALQPFAVSSLDDHGVRT